MRGNHSLSGRDAEYSWRRWKQQTESAAISSQVKDAENTNSIHENAKEWFKRLLLELSDLGVFQSLKRDDGISRQFFRFWFLYYRYNPLAWIRATWQSLCSEEAAGLSVIKQWYALFFSVSIIKFPFYSWFEERDSLLAILDPHSTRKWQGMRIFHFKARLAPSFSFRPQHDSLTLWNKHALNSTHWNVP